MGTKELLEAIGSLKVTELVELVDALKDKFNVQGVPMAAPAAAGGGEGPEEDSGPATVTVVLKNAGGQKIKVIKAVKAALDIGLKEAKELVDKAPTSVKEDISEAEAEELKSALADAGAEVEIE
ncbi:50S ribosomal protein L7/L12 [bacterium]|nr:50S ribosomal protein L7/L12 [bacterium]